MKKSDIAFHGSAPRAEELVSIEEARLAKIAAMQGEIDQLERSYDGCEDISLIGVQVTMNQLGKGTVIEQNMNRIRVAFEGVEKSYILDKKVYLQTKI